MAPQSLLQNILMGKKSRAARFYQGVEKQASGRRPDFQPIACEHLQLPHTAGSRREAPFFNTRTEQLYFTYPFSL
jgi:hypothetical protein